MPNAAQFAERVGESSYRPVPQGSGMDPFTLITSGMNSSPKFGARTLRERTPRKVRLSNGDHVAPTFQVLTPPKLL